MDPNVLRDQLTKLHRELVQVEHIDPRSKQLLAEIMADIQRLIEPADTTAAADRGAAPRPLADRLERIAVQFEAAHPTLAASSRRLVDLLSKAGL